MTKAQEKAARIATNKREAWFKKVRTLTGHIFARLDLVAAKDAYDNGTTADEYAAILASREPVGAAVHALKAAAVAHAADEARKIVERIKTDLAAADWNIEAVAPYPNSWNTPRAEYKEGVAKYQLYHSVTASKNATHRPGAPNIVHMDAERINRFVNNAERDAALQYDMFICKLVAKVGPCVSATLDGDHVWSYSLLRVTKDDNSTDVEIWKTQQIVNYSKFGTPYYQWPSRKV